MSGFLKFVGGVSLLVIALVVGVEIFSSPTPGNSGTHDVTTSLRPSDEGEDALATSTEAARIDFQKEFPTLPKTKLNLRWSDDQIEAGADAQEFASLVTPYGPCIEFDGNTSAGYGLLFYGNYYHDPHGKPTMLGGLYRDRLEAIRAAEDYCHKWYVSERSKPPNVARDSHIWFTPEEEETTPQPPPKPAQAPATDPDGTQPAAPIERQPQPQD